MFHSIHDVLKAEKILKERGVRFELMPVPRNLSSDCGMCIRLKQHVEDVLPLVENIDMAGCFFFNGKEYSAFKLTMIQNEKI